MIAKLLLSGAFLLGVLGFAAEASAQPNPCAHLRNEWSCTRYPTGECFWDHTDWRCESRFVGDARCGWIRNRNHCAWTPGCFWDETDFRCERVF